MKKIIFAFIIIFAMLAGCKQNNISPTKGHVLVEVDPAVAPIIRAEAALFDSLYKNATVTVKLASPLKGIVDIINGKVKMFVTPRYLDKKEIDFINKQKLNINTYKFCYNAIVLITSKKNKLDHIRTDEIKDMLLGKSSSQVSFIIPPNTSETYQYLKNEVLDGKDPKRAEIDSSEEDIIKKIRNGSDKVGIVSFNLIQDSSKINFVQIGQIEKSIDSTKNGDININYFSPHPGYVIKGYYPLKQTVYIYLNELEMSPASGFTTFLTSYEGQKLALQQNLAPGAVPVKINQYQ